MFKNDGSLLIDSNELSHTLTHQVKSKFFCLKMMEVKFEVEIDGNSVVVITSRGDVEVERIF